MKITNLLINKMSELPDNFEHKGERFQLDMYGDASMVGGNAAQSYIYWASETTKKVIKMEYIMNKVGDNHYSGIDRIDYITLWEDYEEGIVLDEWSQ